MLTFDSQGLMPAIVQHAHSGEVLMLGYMNEEALRVTLEQGLVTFWSRSRGELWQKGSTSGNTLHLIEIRQDCDSDALLVLADPAGPTCHIGYDSCFHRTLSDEPVTDPAPLLAILNRLHDRIHQRRSDQAEGSYTAKLLNEGVDRIGRKIGEEAAEVIIAAKNGSVDEVTYEVADLLYHSLVLLEQQGVAPERVWEELLRRYQK